MERNVYAGRDAGGGDDFAVVDIALVPSHIDRLVAFATSSSAEWWVVAGRPCGSPAAPKTSAPVPAHGRTSAHTLTDVTADCELDFTPLRRVITCWVGTP